LFEIWRREEVSRTSTLGFFDGRKLSQADAARVLVGVTVYEVSP
jgi:hypothetical protein